MRMIDLSLSKATTYIIVDGEIVPPFTSLDGLGVSVAEGIEKAREQKMFTSLNDLTNRTKINKTLLAKFRALGILESLEGKQESFGGLFD
jgi:DNA polymerase-3 subunit alpha (Gram-positive type)